MAQPPSRAERAGELADAPPWPLVPAFDPPLPDALPAALPPLPEPLVPAVPPAAPVPAPPAPTPASVSSKRNCWIIWHGEKPESTPMWIG